VAFAGQMIIFHSTVPNAVDIQLQNLAPNAMARAEMSGREISQW
jgi:hypothetical protein